MGNNFRFSVNWQGVKLVLTMGVLCNFLSVGSINGGPPGHW